MSRGAVISMVVVLVIGLAVVLFFSCLERKEVEVDANRSAKARANPFLAAERLLKGMGLGATSHDTLVRPPPTDHVLLLLAPRKHFGQRREAMLLEWVKDGGHLILTPSEDSGLDGGSDPILYHVDVEVLDDSAFYLDLDPGAAEDKEELDLGEGMSVRLQPPGTAESLEVLVYGSISFEDTAKEALWKALDADESIRFLAFKYGEGQITAIADSSFFKSRQIGKKKNARLLWRLVLSDGPEPPGGVWIIHRDEMPGLLALYGGPAAAAFLAGALLLGFWLWGAACRFGPLLPVPPRERRSILEHLDAAAAFLWHAGGRQTLLAAARRRLRLRLELRHITWTHLGSDELSRRLADSSGMDLSRVRRALSDQEITDPHRFTQLVRDIERLRKRL